MATYTAIVTQPDPATVLQINFTIQDYNTYGQPAYNEPYSATPNFTTFIADINAVTGLSDAACTYFSYAGNTTITITVDWDGTIGTMPVALFVGGASSSFTEPFTTTSVCPTCYDVTIEFCASSGLLDIELEPNTDYMIHITDSLNNVYESSATSGPSGSVILLLTDFGGGNLFTPFGGIYEVKFHTTTSDEFVNFTVGTTTYSCINLTVEDVTTT